MANNITKSIELRINLHKAYTDDFIMTIVSKIKNALNTQSVSYNPNRMDLIINAPEAFTNETVKEIINETVISLTSYEHPEMLYTIARLSPNSIIVEL